MNRSDTGSPKMSRSKMSLFDLWSEAVNSAFARPARAALTALGTVLGITTLVAHSGLSRTAGSQIVERFDRLAATQVDVTSARSAETVAAPGSANAPATTPGPIPWDAEQRLERLRGVRAAGTISQVFDEKQPAVTAVPVTDLSASKRLAPDLMSASAGFFRAAEAPLISGRFFDQGHSDRADHVVVLGRDLAKRLGIAGVDGQPAIFIGDEVFSVIGIFGTPQREKSLVDALVIPDGTAKSVYELASPKRVLVDTKLGAATLIAKQAPAALSPNDPSALLAAPGWEPSEVRRGIQSDITGLLVVLGAVSLLVGVVGIANVTLVSVLERVGEIGLRRAIGAGRRHIAAQFLAESVAIGLLAGIVGSALGVCAVVVVAAVQNWTPVLDSWLPIAAVVGGALAGLLAGLYPAIRASRLEPVEALRSGT